MIAKKFGEAAVGDPVGHPDPAAGLDHAEELVGGPLLVGGEHRAEDRHRDVEARVLERERLRLALDEFDVEPLGGGPLAPPLEQGGDEIAADRVAPGPPRRRDRPVAAAAGDVEHPLVGQDLERFGQVFGRVDDQRGDHREVAVGPGPLLRGGDGVVFGVGGHDP